MGSLPIFTITIFVSAFLLFLVQPLVGKLILPKLGGTPQVWNTCMVFFQSVLLLGYAYTHSVSTRLKLRQQLMVHSAILAIPVLLLLLFPIYGTVQEWTPPSGSNPMADTLWLLFRIVGIPFFVVSTSAPLLQRWFAYSGHRTAKDPYFLYSASNLGSLLSLLFYPAMIEPNTFLQTQSLIWFGGYALLFACILYCAYTIFKVAPPDDQLLAENAATRAADGAVLSALKATQAFLDQPPVGDAPAPTPAPAVESSTAVKSGPAPGPSRGIQRKKGLPTPGKIDIKAPTPTVDLRYGAEAPMTWGRRIRWVLLAAVPSSLMLGVTSYISTDLSPFPLVWIIPLSLYLLSFILVYLKGWTGNGLFKFGDKAYTLQDAVIFVLQPLGLLALTFIVLRGGFDPFFATTITMFGFFANALGCHGELAKDRPKTQYLTEYFLCMSFGGMVGGVFNGIIAPLVFQSGVWEFHVAIVIACLVRPEYVPSGWFDELVMNAFPGLRSWARTQGDEMAKSMSKPAPGSTYMFNYFMDVVLGLFVLGLAYVLTTTEFSHRAWRKIAELLSKNSEGTYVFVRNAWLFGIPMIFAFFFAGRPVRMGLAVAGLMLANLYFAERGDEPLEARRTYFGVLRVMQGPRRPDENRIEDKQELQDFVIKPARGREGEPTMPDFNFTYLMHGTTYHGRNYTYTAADQKAGEIRDVTRIATTYYHRYGPVGIVFEQYNWFPGKQNTFHADARMPVSMMGQITASIGIGNLPLAAVIEPWSEPPYATIGLGTGTMASYSRPYQFMTYYEIDDVIRGFSIPEKSDEPGVEPISFNMKGPYRHGTRFTYLQNAIWRGANLEVIMGDARLSLEPKRENNNVENSFIYTADFSKFQDPKGRYYMGAPFDEIHPKKGPGYPEGFYAHRERFYKAIVVDAFSSDAIPIHLLTKQAMEIYLSKLTQDGVLLVHTSNRHMDLVKPATRIVMELSKESQARAEKAVADFDEKELRYIWEKNNNEPAKFDAAQAKELYVNSQKINCLVGKDGAKGKYLGLFGSEYVMVFRGDGFSKWVDKLRAEKEKLGAAAPAASQSVLNSDVIWYDPREGLVEGRFRTPPVTLRDSLWTDDYSYILGVLR